MSRLNEAYRVLSDPGRRLDYDRTLRLQSSARPINSNLDPIEYEWSSPEPPRSSKLSPSGPAKFPWRFVLITGLVGSAIIFVASFFNESPTVESPDGILRSGSCVVIEANTDAREVACTGEGDVVVELLIPTDARCPVGTAAHRDRLGLGTACIRID